MAVVYEEVEEGLIKAYSDQRRKIHGGSPEGNYDVVYDPKDAHRTYVETDEYIDTQVEPVGRVFSKLYLELALLNAGLLDAVDQFIDSQTISVEKDGQVYSMPLRRAYDTALTFSEDNQYFSTFKERLQDVLGITDQQVEQILSACVVK